MPEMGQVLYRQTSRNDLHQNIRLNISQKVKMHRREQLTTP